MSAMRKKEWFDNDDWWRELYPFMFPRQRFTKAPAQVEKILATAQQEAPRVMVIDSIQTVYTDQLQSAPGAVAQVRESAAQLVRYAKQTQTALFLVGHVTKEGTLAGPRVLEHMVDTVLYFESDPASPRYVVTSRGLGYKLQP